MRILVVTQYYFPEAFRINDLVKELNLRGHEIEVLTGLPNYPEGRIFTGYGLSSLGKNVQDNVTVYRVPLVPRGNSSSFRLALNYLSFALSASILGLIFCRQSYDIIFVYEPSPVTVGLPAILLKYIKQARLFFWVQDLWPESITATGALRSNSALKLVSMLTAFIYRHCDKLLIQSRAFHDSIASHGISDSNITYFPNWAEDIFMTGYSSNDRQFSTELPGEFRILFAGNIGKAQSVETIIKAADITRSNQHIHWIIAGTGRNEETIKDLISRLELGNTVHLIGHKPIEEMPALFAAVDVLLVTLRDEAIFKYTIPSKLQTYLASGKPILGALNGEGARIIKESGSGMAVNAEDYKGLADVAQSMYECSETVLSDYGVHAREYYLREFNRDTLIGELEELMLAETGALS